MRIYKGFLPPSVLCSSAHEQSHDSGAQEPQPERVKRKCGRPRNPIPRHKRDSHIMAEHRRRGKIQDCFQALKNMVPRYTLDSGRNSKSNVLTNAVDHCKILQKEIQDLDSSIQNLRAEMEVLNSDIEQCRAADPNSSSIKPGRTANLDDQFQSFVTSQREAGTGWAASNILLSVAKCLFESYKQSIGNQSCVTSFAQSVEQWAVGSLTLNNLRKVFTSALEDNANLRSDVDVIAGCLDTSCQHRMNDSPIQAPTHSSEDSACNTCSSSVDPIPPQHPNKQRHHLAHSTRVKVDSHMHPKLASDVRVNTERSSAYIRGLDYKSNKNNGTCNSTVPSRCIAEKGDDIFNHGSAQEVVHEGFVSFPADRNNGDMLTGHANCYSSSSAVHSPQYKDSSRQHQHERAERMNNNYKLISSPEGKNVSERLNLSRHLPRDSLSSLLPPANVSDCQQHRNMSLSRSEQNLSLLSPGNVNFNCKAVPSQTEEPTCHHRESSWFSPNQPCHIPQEIAKKENQEKSRMSYSIQSPPPALRLCDHDSLQNFPTAKYLQLGINHVPQPRPALTGTPPPTGIDVTYGQLLPSSSSGSLYNSGITGTNCSPRSLIDVSHSTPLTHVNRLPDTLKQANPLRPEPTGSTVDRRSPKSFLAQLLRAPLPTLESIQQPKKFTALETGLTNSTIIPHQVSNPVQLSKCSVSCASCTDCQLPQGIMFSRSNKHCSVEASIHDKYCSKQCGVYPHHSYPISNILHKGHNKGHEGHSIRSEKRSHQRLSEESDDCRVNQSSTPFSFCVNAQGAVDMSLKTVRNSFNNEKDRSCNWSPHNCSFMDNLSISSQSPSADHMSAPYCSTTSFSGHSSPVAYTPSQCRAPTSTHSLPLSVTTTSAHCTIAKDLSPQFSATHRKGNLDSQTGSPLTVSNLSTLTSTASLPMPVSYQTTSSYGQQMFQPTPGLKQQATSSDSTEGKTHACSTFNVWDQAKVKHHAEQLKRPFYEEKMPGHGQGYKVPRVMLSSC